MDKIIKKSLIPTIALGAMILASGQAQAVELVRLIDTFDVTQTGGRISQGFLSQITTATNFPNVLINSPLLGNNINRNLSGQVTTGTTRLSIDANLVDPDTLVGSNNLVVDNGSSMRSIVQITYGTTPPSFTPPVSPFPNITPGTPLFPVVNFKQGKAEGILLGVEYNDSATGVIFNFRDSDGTSGQLPFKTPGSIGGGVDPELKEFYLLFANATAISGGNGVLDFTQITAFNLQVDNRATGNPVSGTSSGADLTIRYIATAKTPEPSSVLGLSALGLLGLMTRKRKKKES